VRKCAKCSAAGEHTVNIYVYMCVYMYIYMTMFLFIFNSAVTEVLKRVAGYHV
jgi:hypothetical protein